MTREELYRDTARLVDQVHAQVEATETLPPDIRERFAELSRQAAFLQEDDVAEALDALSRGGGAFRDLFILRELVSDATVRAKEQPVRGILVDLEPDRVDLLSLSPPDAQLVVDGIGRGETVFFVRFEATGSTEEIIDWVEERYPVVAYREDEHHRWVSFLLLSEEGGDFAENLSHAPALPLVVHAVPYGELIKPRTTLGYSGAIDRVAVDVEARDIELLGLYAGEVILSEDTSEPVQALVAVVERAFSVSVAEMLKGIERQLDTCEATPDVPVHLRAEHDTTRLSVGIAALAETLIASAVCSIAAVAQSEVNLVLGVHRRDNGRELVLRVVRGEDNLTSLASSPGAGALHQVAERVRTTINGVVQVMPSTETGTVVRMELGASPRLMSVARARSGAQTVAIPTAPIELSFSLSEPDVATDPYGGHLVRSLGRLIRLVSIDGAPYRGAKPVGKQCVVYRALSGTVGIVVDALEGHDLVVRNADDSREVYLSSDGTRVPMTTVR